MSISYRGHISVGQNAYPVLFYDFNGPPEPDGTYLVMAGAWLLKIGQPVLFGCRNDDVMAKGTIASGTDENGLVRVRIVGGVYHPSARLSGADETAGDEVG